MDEFLKLINDYSIPVVIMAVIVMTVIGVIKTPLKLFFKRKYGENNKQVKTITFVVFFIAAIGIAFAATAVYYSAILQKAIGRAYVLMAISVFSATQVLYPLYKKVGGRKLLTMLGEAIIKPLIARKMQKNAEAEAKRDDELMEKAEWDKYIESLSNSRQKRVLMESTERDKETLLTKLYDVIGEVLVVKTGLPLTSEQEEAVKKELAERLNNLAI